MKVKKVTKTKVGFNAAGNHYEILGFSFEDRKLETPREVKLVFDRMAKK